MARPETVTLMLDGAGVARALEVPGYRLKVTKGPDKGRELQSGAPRLLIGSQEGADLVLTDRSVSAMHCELVVGTDGFKVRDLGAKNGVFLAGRRVESAFLAPKDEL